jgi:hypothetical protein
LGRARGPVNNFDQMTLRQAQQFYAISMKTNDIDEVMIENILLYMLEDLTSVACGFLENPVFAHCK